MAKQLLLGRVHDGGEEIEGIHECGLDKRTGILNGEVSYAVR